MEKSTFILFLALLSVFAQAYSLQCYVCQNCETVTAEQLQTCAAIEPPPSNSTESPAPPTNGTGTEAPPTDGSTTTTPSSDGSSSTTPSTDGSSSTTQSIDGPGTDNNDIQEQPSALRVKRHALESFAQQNFRVEESYSCYKVVAKVNGTDQTFRGCAPNLNTNQTLCQVINANIINTTTCSSCTTDRCNGATLLQFSLIPLIILFFVVGLNK